MLMNCSILSSDANCKKYRININNSDYIYMKMTKQIYDNCIKPCYIVSKMNLSNNILFDVKLSTQEYCAFFEWIDGVSLDNVISNSCIDNYEYGIMSGELLKKIHSIPIEYDYVLWRSRIKERFLLYYDSFIKLNLKFANDDIAKHLIISCINLLDKRYPSLQHGDFTPQNIIYLKENSTVKAIDFQRCGMGDPYKDFYKTLIFVDSYEYFEGMVHGYFNKQVPDDFFPLLSTFAAYISFHNIVNCYLIGTERKHLKQMIWRAEKYFSNSRILEKIKS